MDRVSCLNASQPGDERPWRTLASAIASDCGLVQRWAAQMLQEFAELLAISGSDAFQVRAL